MVNAVSYLYYDTDFWKADTRKPPGNSGESLSFLHASRLVGSNEGKQNEGSELEAFSLVIAADLL